MAAFFTPRLTVQITWSIIININRTIYLLVIIRRKPYQNSRNYYRVECGEMPWVCIAHTLCVFDNPTHHRAKSTHTHSICLSEQFNYYLLLSVRLDNRGRNHNGHFPFGWVFFSLLLLLLHAGHRIECDKHWTIRTMGEKRCFSISGQQLVNNTRLLFVHESRYPVKHKKCSNCIRKNCLDFTVVVWFCDRAFFRFGISDRIFIVAY